VTRILEDVRYLSDESKIGHVRPGAGKLVVRAESLEFQGKNETVAIQGIKAISFMKMGMGGWVKVEYGNGQMSTALFTGSLSSRGPSKQLYQILQRTCRIDPASEATAEALHRHREDIAEARRRKGSRRMLVGFLIAAVGGIVTAVTYARAASSPTGGHYVVAWGAILFGILLIISGLVELSQAGSSPEQKVPSPAATTEEIPPGEVQTDQPPASGTPRPPDSLAQPLTAAQLELIYEPYFDVAGLLPEERERLKQHTLSPFSTLAVIALHMFTLGVFTTIYCGLKHSKLPRIKHDDFAAFKGIASFLIPLFNIYWEVFFWLRLTDRINFQYRLRDLRPPVDREFIKAVCFLMLIPFVNFAILLLVVPFAVRQIQLASNQLARETFAEDNVAMLAT
jgi:hypothetical protein